MLAVATQGPAAFRLPDRDAAIRCAGLTKRLLSADNNLRGVPMDYPPLAIETSHPGSDPMRRARLELKGSRWLSGRQALRLDAAPPQGELEPPTTVPVKVLT